MDFEDRLIAGRYRLLGQIGRGGFGAVFRAAESGVKRHVAVKLLHDPRADAETRARFEREARVVQRLRHPNTVEILDVGHDADGTPFIVYELLEGRTLAQTLAEEGALAPERALHVVRQVLKSLAEAHAQGVVHRDLKPSNVMLVHYAGEHDFVKVLDFGIARSLRPDTQLVTADGHVLGTPAYMAPEQLRGDPPKPSADVYAVGLMLLEMLTGRRVFRGPPIEVARAQVGPEPIEVPVGFRGTALGDVLTRAVLKHEPSRHRDAHALLTALGGVSRPTPPAAPAELAPAAALPTKRHRSPLPWVVAGAAGALLLALGTALALYLLLGQTAPPVAVEPPSAAAPRTSSLAPPSSRNAVIGVSDPERAELGAVALDMQRVVRERHPSAQLVQLDAYGVHDGLVDLRQSGVSSATPVMAEFEDETTRITVSVYPSGYVLRESTDRKGAPALPRAKCDSRAAWRALHEASSDAGVGQYMGLYWVEHGGKLRFVWTFHSNAPGSTQEAVDAMTCAQLW